jgi:hypothetical protein
MSSKFVIYALFSAILFNGCFTLHKDVYHSYDGVVFEVKIQRGSIVKGEARIMIFCTITNNSNHVYSHNQAEFFLIADGARYHLVNQFGDDIEITPGDNEQLILVEYLPEGANITQLFIPHFGYINLTGVKVK